MGKTRTKSKFVHAKMNKSEHVYIHKDQQHANYCIFIIMNEHVVGWENTRTKFGCTCQDKIVHIPISTRAKLCDLGIGITWVHVSRLPTAAPRQ